MREWTLVRTTTVPMPIFSKRIGTLLRRKRVDSLTLSTVLTALSGPYSLLPTASEISSSTMLTKTTSFNAFL